MIQSGATNGIECLQSQRAIRAGDVARVLKPASAIPNLVDLRNTLKMDLENTLSQTALGGFGSNRTASSKLHC